MLQVLLSASSHLLTLLVHAAWQAGLLALVVLAVTWLLGNHLAPRWRFALWLVVFVRLALPIVPSAPWSIFRVISATSQPETVVANEAAFALPPPTVDARTKSPADDLNDNRLLSAGSSPAVSEQFDTPLSGDIAALPLKRSGWSWIQFAALAWLAGVVVQSLRWINNELQLRRLQRRWLPITDHALLAMFRDCINELRSHRSVSLFATHDNLGPATCGILQPRIVIPQKLLERLSSTELRLVLLHELVHVRRHDVLVDRLTALVAIFHWFNPVVWVSQHFLRRERELACDAAVLDQTGTVQASEYGHVILATIQSLAPPVAIGGLVGMFSAGAFSLLRRRIQRIAAYRKTGWRSLLLGAISVSALALAGLTDAQTKAPQAKKSAANPPAKDEAPAQSELAKDAAGQKDKNGTPNDSGYYQVPISVSGRAVDQNGRPIAGADIYLAANQPGNQRIAESKTAADGTYKFENVPLWVARAETNKGDDAGGFEVFGAAQGFALAWQQQAWLLPKHKTASGDRRFGTDDQITMDLEFGPSTSIRGRIVDDLGQPIPETKLAIRYSDPEWNASDIRVFRYDKALASLNEAAIVPPEIKTRLTDADGRFEFTGLRADHRWRIDVRPPGHPMRWIYVVTHDGVTADSKGNRVYSGDFELVFPRTRPIRAQVIYDDTGKPAAKVGVSGGNETGSFFESADENGFIEAALPDGRATLVVSPRIGTPYLRTSTEIVVSAETTKDPFTVRLRPAAVLNITVIDADTRAPLSGADIWNEQSVVGSSKPYRRVHGYYSWEAETRISHYEKPRSDEKGKMQVFFEPGKHRIGVGLEAYPKGYEPVDPDGKEIDCQPGAPTAIQFEMRKKAADGAQKQKAHPATVATDPPAEPAGRVFPTSISGRGLDEQGRPVEGAAIYLVKTNGEEKVLGRTTTDVNGHYDFRDAPLESNGIGPWHEMAYFRVVGQAPGKAFAWRGMKNLYIDPQVAARAGMNNPDSYTPNPRLSGFVRGEKIELDLTFLPPKPITGRIVNDRGAPVKGVQVTLKQCDYIDARGKPINEHETFRIWVWMTRRAPFVMPDQLYAITDDDGKFELPSAPLGVVCNLGLAHPSYAAVTHYVSTADNPPATLRDSPILKLPLEITLCSVLAVPVQTMLADTDEPAAHVRLDANEISAGQRLPGGGTFAGGESDKDGKLTLKLPPGKYRLLGHPPPGIAYLRTAREVTVDESTAREPVTLRLERGCSLILKAVDADTGKPIQGVTFRSADRNRFSFMELSPTQTNEQGEVRCTVTPGAGRYEFRAELPDGYQADPQEDRQGRTIDLPAGGIVQETFKLRK